MCTLSQEERKQEELAKWLKDRRDQRAEDRRMAEELRVQKMQVSPTAVG